MEHREDDRMGGMGGMRGWDRESMGSDIGIKKQFILYSFTSGGGGGGKVWRAIFSIMQWPNTVQEKYICLSE